MSKPPMPRTSRALVLLNIQTSLCFHKGHDFSSIFVLCRNIFPLFDSLQSSCDGKSLWHWTQSTLSKFLNFLKLTLWWWWWWWWWRWWRWFGDGLYIHVSQGNFSSISCAYLKLPIDSDDSWSTFWLWGWSPLHTSHSSLANTSSWWKMGNCQLSKVHTGKLSTWRGGNLGP